MYYEIDFDEMERQEKIKTQKTEKHGHWQRVSPFVDSLECSECGYEILSEELKTPYCAWCGAKMDEVI